MRVVKVNEFGTDLGEQKSIMLKLDKERYGTKRTDTTKDRQH